MVIFAEQLAGFAISALSPFSPALKKFFSCTLPVSFFLLLLCVALCLQYVMTSVGKTTPLHHSIKKWIRT